MPKFLKNCKANINTQKLCFYVRNLKSALTKEKTLCNLNNFIVEFAY